MWFCESNRNDIGEGEITFNKEPVYKGPLTPDIKAFFNATYPAALLRIYRIEKLTGSGTQSALPAKEVSFRSNRSYLRDGKDESKTLSSVRPELTLIKGSVENTGDNKGKAKPKLELVKK